MPDHRLSRLLKAKLLRRSSSSAVPQTKAGNGADPRADPNSASDSPCGLSPHLFTHQADAKSRAFSFVSSLPVEGSSSPDEIAGPATGSTDQGNLFSHIDDPAAKTEEEVQRSDNSYGRSGSEQQGHHPVKAVSAPTSRLQTPPTEPPSRSTTPPLPSPQQLGGTSLPAAQSQVRGGAAIDPQLTPYLDSVAGNPRRDPNCSSSFTSSAAVKRPSLAVRRQSLLPPSQQHLIRGLLDPSLLFQNGGQDNSRLTIANAEMAYRKVWVKRPGGSATLVSTLDDSVVDELRDQIVRKYANSIGKSFDSPDVVIRISPREGPNRQSTPERTLSPEESLSSVLDTYYPGGQTVEEALVIDIPQRRTPKPSPRHSVYYHHSEPGEHGDYFPLMPVNANVPTPPANSANAVNAHGAPAISILTTGMAPPLPSPGSRTRHPRRPPLTRHTTNSPTMLGSAPGVKDANISTNGQPPAPAPSVPSPPAPPPESPQNKAHTPPTRVASPRVGRKTKKTSTPLAAGVFGGLIDGTVPPINVLIVEDNIINQKLLEAFMKRLSVRWKCAANGEEAVRKWRQGGFHLVLMDIQLPVMNGLEATKEIRRLERLNGIGVFPKTASGRSSAASATATSPSKRGPDAVTSLSEEDTLHDLSLFKSPVIIVALTASSLQSDRHEALAAGCNDFLTKPVGFPWLEQKVTEWGCMQALIDFEGWRKWRGFADSPQQSPTVDSHASPMQIGSGDITKRGSSSPVSSRSTVVQKTDRRRSSGSRRDSNTVRPAELVAGDSSGSGGSAEALALDSPASIATSVKVEDLSGANPAVE